jgi:hypothetical protein
MDQLHIVHLAVLVALVDVKAVVVVVKAVLADVIVNVPGVDFSAEEVVIIPVPVDAQIHAADNVPAAE